MPGTVTRRIYNLFIVRAVAGVTFQGVSKIYPDGTRAVNDLNLGIEDGEFLVLVGPSGLRQDDRAADGRRARGDLGGRS